MKNQVYLLDRREADTYAEDYFLSICGLKDRQGDKYRRMLNQGMQIKERISGGIDLKAVVSGYDRDILSGNRAEIGEATFVCNAFQQMNREAVQRVYAYILTAGSFELDDSEPVIDQLYADIWGTAYTDAGLEVLKNRLMEEFSQRDADAKGDTRAAILEPFGPGYYGMDVDQVGKFFEVLDGESIGVKARTNSLMLPLKSCAGFFVIADEGAELPPDDCKSCRSDHSGCEFCQAVIKKKSIFG